MKIKLLVACHNSSDVPSDDIYFPIQVGKALNTNVELGITCDNDGDNISDKNKSFCELTALYWAWKNLKEMDYVGLCHYRRYFDLSSACSVDVEPSVVADISYLPNIDRAILSQILNRYDIVLSPNNYGFNSVAAQYFKSHNKADLKKVENVIQAKFPDYMPAYKAVMYRRNYYAPFNMLIASKTVFDDYCNWLFTILFDVENQVDISSYDNYQKRVFGFLSERLLNVYVYHNKLKVCQRPVVSVNTGTSASVLYQMVRRMFCSCVFNIRLLLKLN